MATSNIWGLSDVNGLKRLHAEIPIPGITEPKMVMSLPIGQPGASDVPPQRILERNRRYIKMHAKSKARERDLPLFEIERVDFNLFSTEDIDTIAVVNVTVPDAYGPGTVRDLKMGPHSHSDLCEVCSRDLRGCDGHHGKIVLPKLMHPLTAEEIILVLTDVCNTCGALLVSNEDLIREGIKKSSRKKRLQEIRDLVSRKKSRCTGEKCAPSPVYASYRENKDDYRLAYTYAGAEKNKHYRTPEEIYTILQAITDQDAELLGFEHGSRPEDMIMERLLVIPYCSRPDLNQGSKFVPDDLTLMYIDILKRVIDYNSSSNEVDKDAALKDLYFKIGHFMKNDGRYNRGGSKIYTDLKTRLQGKRAVIRGHTMGKRVDFSGRTVVGPGAFLRVDEVGLPRKIATKLTRPIEVNEMNRAELQSKYEAGKITHLVSVSGSFAGERIMVTKNFRKKYQRLNTGDTVHRMLEDGDLVIVNRQPTLHKQNVLALKVKIIDERVIRINLSITTPMNADFDGDELNIHVPQTIEAYAEAEQLLSIPANLMSAQTNKPMMAIVYDSLSGAYLLTYYENEYIIVKKEIEKLEEKFLKTTQGTEEFDKLGRLLEKQRARYKVIGEKQILDKDIYDQCLMTVYDTPQYGSLKQRLAYYGVPEQTGRALFSATLPEDFDYNNGEVQIKNGILIKGLLSKKTIGNVDGSIISEMFKQLGGMITVDFMSNLQFMINAYLQMRGFSIGLSDCIPTDKRFKEAIATEIEKATLKVIALAGKTSNKITEHQREMKILSHLDFAKNKADVIINEYIEPENSMLVAANSGAKGSKWNVVQISTTLGQQKVGNRRIPANLPGNRSLSVFEPNDPHPRAKGFCVNSFSSGLEPSEFFFHAQGSREGLTDTAVNTSQTGALQHQIIKSLEDVHISADGSVRVADNTIVQFVYGDDGFDSSKLTSIKIGDENVPFFRNISLLADKINRKYCSA